MATINLPGGTGHTDTRAGATLHGDTVNDEQEDRPAFHTTTKTGAALVVTGNRRQCRNQRRTGVLLTAATDSVTQQLPPAQWGEASGHSAGVLIRSISTMRSPATRHADQLRLGAGWRRSTMLTGLMRLRLRVSRDLPGAIRN